jgi:hypothetical protein
MKMEEIKNPFGKMESPFPKPWESGNEPGMEPGDDKPSYVDNPDSPDHQPVAPSDMPDSPAMPQTLEKINPSAPIPTEPEPEDIEKILEKYEYRESDIPVNSIYWHLKSKMIQEQAGKTSEIVAKNKPEKI